MVVSTLPHRIILIASLLFVGSKANGQSINDVRMKGLQFLEVTQAEDGSWTSSQSVGITGLVVTSMMESGRSVDDLGVEKALAFIVSNQQPDGGIHVPDSRFRNYETCIAVLALSEANKDGRYDDIIKNAETNLRSLIWDESKGLESSDAAYGGGGYDSKRKRPAKSMLWAWLPSGFFREGHKWESIIRRSSGRFGLVSSGTLS
jgi:hypothetical protein